MKQKTFEFKIHPKTNLEDFYVTNSNIKAYNYVLSENNFIKYSIIYGPIKSGKSHLGLIWKNKNNAIVYYKNNYNKILKHKKNVFIDDFSLDLNEEYLFHIINHCFSHNLKILLCTNKLLSDFNFQLKDLSSRLKSFNFIKINEPDDELIVNLIIKLLYDKQIIINNPEILLYILKRINRTYKDIYLFVESIDQLSLEKKRQLTIPLIKNLL